jgi:hypothetical protein
MGSSPVPGTDRFDWKALGNTGLFLDSRAYSRWLHLRAGRIISDNYCDLGRNRMMPCRSLRPSCPEWAPPSRSPKPLVASEMRACETSKTSEKGVGRFRREGDRHTLRDSSIPAILVRVNAFTRCGPRRAFARSAQMLTRIPSGRCGNAFTISATSADTD